MVEILSFATETNNMKVVISKRADGAVRKTSCNMELALAMTQDGLGWSPEEVALEIHKRTVISDPPMPEDLAAEWAFAVGQGGLATVDEAMILMSRMGRWAGNVQGTGDYGDPEIIDDSRLPPDLTNVGRTLPGAFRDAIRWDGTQCVCDMPHARGIHMDRIRTVRNAELVKKDLASLRAIEAGDTSAQSTIAAEKQTLRDIPQTFDLTTPNDTPEELKAMWPAELND